MGWFQPPNDLVIQNWPPTWEMSHKNDRGNKDMKADPDLQDGNAEKSLGGYPVAVRPRRHRFGGSYVLNPPVN